MSTRPLAIAALLLPAAALAGRQPVFPDFPQAPEYGRVTLDRFSTAAGVPPVTFQHWQHRGLFTCRLCHVDVGFAMAAGETRVSAETNRKGLHCGACHDGKTVHDGKPIFAACSEAGKVEVGSPCRRCHDRPSRAEVLAGYRKVATRLPEDRLGLVDWEAAEERGLVKPLDVLAGISIPRPALRLDRDVSIQARGTWLGNVTFSHKKHALWNGCEVCHPEIFPLARQGAERYDMAQIRAGQACGACHNKVAFPIAACLRCHRDRGGRF